MSWRELRRESNFGTALVPYVEFMLDGMPEGLYKGVLWKAVGLILSGLTPILLRLGPFLAESRIWDSVKSCMDY